MEKAISIIGTGSYLPEAVDSSTIEERYGIPQGYSERYSGVKTRHQVTFESNAFMGAKALEEACENANLNINNIDLLISAASSYDQPLPHQSSLIKYELLGGQNVFFPTMDIDCTCLSFLAAFEVATALLDGNRYKTIAIVSSEIASKGLSPNRQETKTLFGDAAAAFILQYDEKSNSRFIKSSMKTYTEGVHYTMIKGGGNAFPFKDFPYDQDFHSFDMEGIKLLKLAKKTIPNFLNEFFSDIPYILNDSQAVLSHQASKTGLDLIKSLIELDDDKFKTNLAHRGNCIAASLPLLLHEVIKAGDLQRGELCTIMGSSAGFSLGCLLFKY